MKDRTVDELCLEVLAYEREFERWTQRAKAIIKRYRDDEMNIVSDWSSSWGKTRYNILWSNVQTTSPAVYARTPVPECERRYKDPDPLGRFTAEVLERIASYLNKETNYSDTMKLAVKDLLLPGRGTACVRYEFEEGPALTGPDGQPVMDEEGAEVPDMEAAEHRVKYDFVLWKDYGHNVATKADDICMKWRRVFMNKDEAEGRFKKTFEGLNKGSTWDQVTFGFQSENYKSEEFKTASEQAKKLDVIELWDEETKKVYWFSPKGFKDGFLDIKDDPLHLRGFFPFPAPLYATTTTDSLVPIADYCQYMHQAEQLDLLVARRQLLIQAIRVVGARNAGSPELDRVLSVANENEIIPVHDWATFAAQGGFKGSLDFLPLDVLIAALGIVNESIEQIKQELYEVSGMSDILRGATDPRETLGAQQMKGQFAGLRLQEKQRDVQKFARDLMTLGVEVVLEHFSDQAIFDMAEVALMRPEDQQMFPQALGLLRDDKLRTYRLSIETDSTVTLDKDAEKASRIEMVDKVGGYMQSTMQGLQAFPQFAPALAEILMYAIRSYNAGPSVEASIEQAMRAAVQQTMQPPPEQGPDPQVQMQQQDMQMRMQSDQMKMQADAQKMQMDAQSKQAEFNLKLEELKLKQAELQANLEIQAAKLRSDAESKKYDTDTKAALELNKLQFDAEMKAKEIQANQIESALAREAARTPGGAEGGSSGGQSMPPIEINVHKPGKKRANIVRDPITGNSVVDIQEID